MKNRNSHIQTIGIALSYVPEYSETFFKNKILGLQKSNYKVVLFVDYRNEDDNNYGCDIIYSPKLHGNIVRTSINSIITLLKAFVFYPKTTINLYKLDRQDNLSWASRIKSIIFNQFYFTEKLDWLHFGFGMNAINRENVAVAIGAKMAVSFRGSDLYLTPLKHKNCYNKLFSKEVRYHVLSQEMKQTLLDYNVNQKTINIITPAIDNDFFNKASQIKTSNVLRLTTVARLHWKKGLEYTLEALSILKKLGIDFTYTIIGEGAERERLIFAAHQLDIIDKVKFLGKLNHDEVKNSLSKTDIYLQYSIQEGFSNAVLEAQAMGILCIVSNAEGLPENILNNETGWVINKREPKTLAKKIMEINNLSSIQKDIIRNKAIERVKQKFNLKKQREEFVEFYN